MGLRFTHETLPQRVAFASFEAARHVADEVGRLGGSRAMVIAGEAERAPADEVAADVPVAVRHSEVVMHVPIDVAERARKAAADHGVDVLGERRRGVDDGPRHRCADHRPADRRRPDHVRGLGGHRGVGADRGRSQDDRGGCPGAAAGRRLRRRPHAVPAGAAHRGLRPQRRGALRRLDVGASHEPDRPGARLGGPVRPDQGTSAGGGPPRGRRRSRAGPLRRLLGGARVRLGRFRVAPTRSVTCSAGRTTSRTRRPTPWCCRTSWRSTRPRSPESSGGWRPPSARHPPSKGCSAYETKSTPLAASGRSRRRRIPSRTTAPSGRCSPPPAALRCGRRTCISWFRRPDSGPW
jgi:hypothetical protein